MAFVELPLNKAFMLFEPGPVILVSTNDGKKNNLMTISWHMVTDFTPSLALTTGPWNHSFKVMMKTKECVLAVPTVDLAEKVVSIGDCSGKEVDKFRKFELTPLVGNVALRITWRPPVYSCCRVCKPGSTRNVKSGVLSMPMVMVLLSSMVQRLTLSI